MRFMSLFAKPGWLSSTLFIATCLGCQSAELSDDELQARCADLGSEEAVLVDVFRRQALVDTMMHGSNLLTRTFFSTRSALDDIENEGLSGGAARNHISGWLDVLADSLNGTVMNIELARELDATILTASASGVGTALPPDSYCAIADIVQMRGFDEGLMSAPRILADQEIQEGLDRLAVLCPGRFDEARAELNHQAAGVQ